MAQPHYWTVKKTAPFIRKKQVRCKPHTTAIYKSMDYRSGTHERLLKTLDTLGMKQILSQEKTLSEVTRGKTSRVESTDDTS